MDTGFEVDEEVNMATTNWDEPASPAPTPETERGWADEFELAVDHMVVDWKSASDDHDSVMQFRRDAGLPMYDEELWTEENEQAFQSVGHVVNVISRYYLELKDGLRGVGRAGEDIGVLAELGETQVVIDNAKIVFRNAGQARPAADPTGFVGLTGAEVAVGIAGAVVIVAVTVGTVYAVSSVCQVARDRIAQLREKSIKDYEKSLTDGGLSQADAHKQAMDYMQHSQSLVELQNRTPNPGNEFVDTIKTTLWVVFGVAVIGGVIYLAGPAIRNVLTSTVGKMGHASPNPVLPAQQHLDAFTQSYVETALWSSMDESDESGGEPLDKNYTISDIDRKTLQKMIDDCRRFERENSQWLSEGTDEQGGHDFWLTRNGHGAGFWDGGWPEPAAEHLTKSAESYGAFELYVGDDGKIYSI